MKVSYFINIPEVLRPSVDLALIRFGYLFPECEAKAEDAGVCIEAPSQALLDEGARQLRYLLYREKILRGAQPTRDRVMWSLFGQ